MPSNVPSVGILNLSGDFTAYEAIGHTRWLFKRQWGLQCDELISADVASGLDGLDVLAVPAGGINVGLKRLRKKGQKELIRWVNQGGRLIGWRYGAARLAYVLGMSRARYDYLTESIDGPMVKALVDADSPLAEGVGRSVWPLVDTASMTAPRSVSPVRFPTKESGNFRVSGLRRGTHRLWGTTAVADERFGQGRSIVFSFEPLYGGGSEGTQKILFNAVLGPNPKRSRPTAPVEFDADRIARRMAATTAWVDGPDPDVH